MEVNIPDYTEYKELLKKRLSEKRYHHSLCVADEALRLALRYGADPQKAYLAGLLHDITKNAPAEEHFYLFDTFGVVLNEVEKNAEKLWHAMSGAVYVRNLLQIDDDEIVGAIRYHTTARENLPLLGKVLYLADFSSADRDYDDVDIMRRLVDSSLDEAYAYALKYTVNELVGKNSAIHTDTVAAYNETMLKRSKNIGN